MFFNNVIVAVALAPFVAAHGGAPVPHISGLNIKDLKARDLLSNLNARASEVHRHVAHEERGSQLEVRQNTNTNGQCGGSFGSCAPGVCCSGSGCR